MTARPQANAGSMRAGWRAPLGLLLLGMLPVIAGAFRLEQLSGISDVMPANPRFSPMPLPVVLHIVSATVFATLGPLQFAAGFRRRWPTWHRMAGRLLVVCGLLVALTGLWMTMFYAPADGTGALLFVSRIVFGVAMVASIVVGLAAVLRRDINRHRAWMARGYAIGLGAATQMLVLMVAGIVAGIQDELTHDSLMALSWVINSAAPLAAAALWGLLVAPAASGRLPDPWRLIPSSSCSAPLPRGSFSAATRPRAQCSAR